MRVAIACLVFLGAATVAAWLWQSPDVVHWVVTQQRAFQTEMANDVFGLKTGSPGAWAGLLAAAGAYGFVHAIGPGHGKYLIGGVGLGTQVSAARLLAMALASSLAQALWAIALVYGGFFLLEVSAQRMTALAEEFLAPASYLAIAAVGAVLVWRGLRTFVQQAQVAAPAGHAHDHETCGCHGHGPSPDEVANLGSLREALLLIGSIAIRPCTGAIFLLVIAWQMDIQAAGATAVIVMGLGTAAFVSLVAVSSVAARGMTFASLGDSSAVPLLTSSVQVAAGALIILASITLLGIVL